MYKELAVCVVSMGLGKDIYLEGYKGRGQSLETAPVFVWKNLCGSTNLTE